MNIEAEIKRVELALRELYREEVIVREKYRSKMIEIRASRESWEARVNWLDFKKKHGLREIA